MKFDIIRAFAAHVIATAPPTAWTYQGLGMLRLYVSKELRLHLWDPDLAVGQVSTLHNHPWDFDSLVLAGEVRNVRYARTESGQAWMSQTIQCGEGGCQLGTPQTTWLTEQPTEFIHPGETYSQRAYEIHDSRPMPGTVTLIQRHFHPDEDHAEVFWPVGSEWVSAEPRPATSDEIQQFQEAARMAWDLA